MALALPTGPGWVTVRPDLDGSQLELEFFLLCARLWLRLIDSEGSCSHDQGNSHIQRALLPDTLRVRVRVSVRIRVMVGFRVGVRI